METYVSFQTSPQDRIWLDPTDGSYQDETQVTAAIRSLWDKAENCPNYNDRDWAAFYARPNDRMLGVCWAWAELNMPDYNVKQWNFLAYMMSEPETYDV
jgi:hypothetical protein